MSLAFEKIQVVPVRSAATNVDQPVHYHAYLGGSTITYKEVMSTSYSNSQISFTANPPSPSVIIDREVLMKLPVRVTLNGTAAAGTRLIQNPYNAFRQMPIHSVISNLQLTLNNTKMTIESSEVVHEMMCYYDDEKDLENFSLSPAYPDQSQEYSELANLTNRNPLAQWGEKNSGAPFRGGFPYTAISNPVNGTVAYVEATLCEPLMISPLLFGGMNGKGLIGVQNMSVQLNLDANLSRMWSLAAGSGSTITSITVSITAQPSLLFKYISPSPTMELPKSVEYELQNVETYVSELGASQAPGTAYLMNSSNIQLNVVPSHLMIFAKERRGDRTYLTTDSWQSIESIDVSFANVSGILSGADKRELYKISKENGVKKSWQEWCGEAMYIESGGNSVAKHGIGSVLCLKFGKDIALNDPSVSTGVPGTFNLSCRVNLKNQNPSRSISPALYVVPIYAGVLTIKENQAIQQLAVISQNDVLNAADEADEEGAVDGASLEGGKFFGDVAKFARQALPYVRAARKVGQKVASVLPPTPQTQAIRTGLDIAEQVGLGRKQKGGVLVGGAKMSRSELRKALQL